MRTAELALKRMIVNGAQDANWNVQLNPVDRGKLAEETEPGLQRLHQGLADQHLGKRRRGARRSRVATAPDHEQPGAERHRQQPSPRDPDYLALMEKPRRRRLFLHPFRFHWHTLSLQTQTSRGTHAPHSQALDALPRIAANAHAPATMMISIIIVIVKMMTKIINPSPESDPGQPCPTWSVIGARQVDINTCAWRPVAQVRHKSNQINFINRKGRKVRRFKHFHSQTSL